MMFPGFVLTAVLVLMVNSQEDISCRPRETLVATMSAKPQFKILHRCSGLQSLKDPARFRCVATEAVDVSVDVMNQIGKPATRKLRNETKCETRCVCGCQEQHPVPCDIGFKWDNVKCDCVPSCGSGKASTGASEVTGGVSYPIFITALAAELVVVLVIVFITLDACRCRRQKKGVMFKTRQYVRSLSASVPEQRKLTLKGELSGSVTFIEGSDERARV